MRYILVEWPDIQDYMDNPDYPEKCYFDPNKNVWFVPETWDEEYMWIRQQFDTLIRDYLDLNENF
jgi:hypothetical protein